MCLGPPATARWTWTSTGREARLPRRDGERRGTVAELGDLAADGARVDLTGGLAHLGGLHGRLQRADAEPDAAVFAFVLGLAFILMLVSFRSIVVPVKAIVLNLLSVGAAYGMIVLVFQDGVGAGLLGFESRRTASRSYLPLFLFAILFGLSDGLPRVHAEPVREAFGRGRRRPRVRRPRNQDDRRHHHRRRGSSWSPSSPPWRLGDLVRLQQMGFGLAFAVLIDATLIRCVLVPASMELLGDRNWYLPRWLQWLPRFDSKARPGARRRALAGSGHGFMPDPPRRSARRTGPGTTSMRPASRRAACARAVRWPYAAADDRRQGTTRADAELPVGAVQVGLDRLDREEQPGGGLLVGEAGRGQRRDLQLLRRELVDGVRRTRARSVSPLARSSLSVRSTQGAQRMRSKRASAARSCARACTRRPARRSRSPWHRRLRASSRRTPSRANAATDRSSGASNASSPATIPRARSRAARAQGW